MTESLIQKDGEGREGEEEEKEYRGGYRLRRGAGRGGGGVRGTRVIGGVE